MVGGGVGKRAQATGARKNSADARPRVEPSEKEFSGWSQLMYKIDTMCQKQQQQQRVPLHLVARQWPWISMCQFSVGILLTCLLLLHLGGRGKFSWAAGTRRRRG